MGSSAPSPHTPRCYLVMNPAGDWLSVGLRIGPAGIRDEKEKRGEEVRLKREKTDHCVEVRAFRERPGMI